jgi:hypothetical protein
MITMAELNGFMHALPEALQMLNVLVKKFRMDKDKNEGIKKISNLIKGMVSALGQC